MVKQKYFQKIPGFTRPSYIIKCSCPRFANGEGKAIIHDSVRGHDIYIIADIGNYSCQFKMHGISCAMSPDDHFQDIKRVVSAISGTAHRVNVIMPMLYQSRQHKRQHRESLDCSLALRELEYLGVQNIITFDAHNSHVQNAVPLRGFENLHASYQIVKAWLDHESKLRIDKESMLVVSPDEGAVDRSLYYANSLGLELGMFYKRRDTTRVINGKNPIIAHEFMGADVKYKDILIIDDLLASGQSILKVASELKKRGANNIYIFVTFALLDEKGCEKYEQAFRNGLIRRLYATNLTYSHERLDSSQWFVKVDISDFVAYFIERMNRNESISALLNSSSKIARRLRKK